MVAIVASVVDPPCSLAPAKVAIDRFLHAICMTLLCGVRRQSAHGQSALLHGSALLALPAL